MKKILFFFITISLFASCNKDPYADIHKELSGNHELRKLSNQQYETVEEYSNSSWGAGFFLVAGGASGSSESGTKVTRYDNLTFSWKDGYGNYVMSTVPSSKVRINVIDNLSSPYIRISYTASEISRVRSWSDNPTYSEDPLFFCKYIVIYCNEAQYPYNINFTNIHEKQINQ